MRTLPTLLRTALAVFVVAGLSGCDSVGLEVDAGVDAVVTDSGAPDATVEDIAESDADDPSEDIAQDGSGDAATDTDADGSGDAIDARDPDADPPECIGSGDCAIRHDCIDGVCVLRCVRDSECDDLNVCTEDACVDGHCASRAISPPPQVGDPVAGDCRHDVCADGRLETFPDSDDVPADDGVFCTEEACAGMFPVHRPNHEVCDDGSPDNGYESCSVSAGGCVLGDTPPWFCEDPLPGWERDETCGDGQDNDGDGLIDEHCPCEVGTVLPCYAGPPSSRAVGGCLDGYMVCVDRDDPHWGECRGQILPAAETCDLKDNDCNGCVDDVEECEPVLTCPTEDFARPLRWYPLDASAIFDTSDSSIDSVRWTVVAPPNSSTTAVEDADAVETRVYMDVSGAYQIGLRLDTDKGALECSWVVHAAGSGIRVEMRWDTFGMVDMDLHVHRSGTTTNFCTADDCYYANCRAGGTAPPWGYPTSPASACDAGGRPCGNPRLDIDNIRGYDPENINIDNPNDGDTFRVMAHKYSGTPVTNPVLSVYCGGRLRGVFGEAPDEASLDRAAGACGGNTWRVADVRMIVDPDTGATDCEVFGLDDGEGGWDIRTGTAEF